MESGSTCTAALTSTLALCWLGPNHFMTLLPGSVDLKAIRTTTVFARRHERQRAKLIPNAGYLMRQSQSEGSPMNNRPTRKQTARNTKRRKLNSMLLARTSGVSLYVKNMMRIEREIHAPKTDTAHRTIPNNSWKDRNSIVFGMQRSLALLGHVSSEQCEHSKESDNGERKEHFSLETPDSDSHRSVYIWVTLEIKDRTQHTSLIANFSLSTGDTIKTADGFPLSPGDAGTWRTTVAAYRPGSLRGRIQPLRKTLI